MDFRSIKAVAFDAFGTLVEIHEKRRPFARLANMSRISATRSPMTERLGLVQMSDVWGIDLEPWRLAALTSDLEQELASTRPYPETKEVLARLRHRGFRIAVASNLARPYAAPIEKELGSLLDVFCYSFDVGAIKPDPRFYEALCRQLQLEPNQILMVGDTWRCDYEGATAAGLKAIHLDRRNTGDTEHSVVSIADLRSVLSALVR